MSPETTYDPKAAADRIERAARALTPGACKADPAQAVRYATFIRQELDRAEAAGAFAAIDAELARRGVR